MKDLLRISAFCLIIAGTLAIGINRSSKNRQLPVTLSPEDISWIEFCKATGHDIHDTSEETVTEFLETWQSSPIEDDYSHIEG